VIGTQSRAACRKDEQAIDDLAKPLYRLLEAYRLVTNH
jgi:hypothetical protein